MNDWIIVYDDELQHHGIKGQTWGVRHGPPYPLNSSDSKAIMKAKTAYKNSRVKAAKRRAHKANKNLDKTELTDKNMIDIRQLSDDELRSRIARLQMEKNYKLLVSDLQSKNNGTGVNQYLKELGIKSSKRAAEAVAPKVMEYMVKQMIKNVGKLSNEQYKEMFPNKKK